MDTKKAVICIVLFLLMQVSIFFAVADATQDFLYYPEDYEGKTLVFEKSRIEGPIVKNNHAGIYCLRVEIDGSYIPGYLYKSQLNFVVASHELANKLTTQPNRNLKNHKPNQKLNGMNHLTCDGACSVKLTTNIQKQFGYWMAVVSKIEFYGERDSIINTVE